MRDGREKNTDDFSYIIILFLVAENKLQSYAKPWRRQGQYAFRGNKGAASQSGLRDGEWSVDHTEIAIYMDHLCES